MLDFNRIAGEWIFHFPVIGSNRMGIIEEPSDLHRSGLILGWD